MDKVKEKAARKMKDPAARITELNQRIENLLALRDRLKQFPHTITFDVGTTVADALKVVILTTYAWCGENKSLTCEVLGISRRGLYNHLAKWGMLPAEVSAEDEGPEAPPAAEVAA